MAREALAALIPAATVWEARGAPEPQAWLVRAAFLAPEGQRQLEAVTDLGEREPILYSHFMSVAMENRDPESLEREVSPVLQEERARAA